MNIHPFIWIGVFLIFIGTICTFFGQQITNNKSSQLLQQKSENIEKLSRDNIALNTEISQLNKQIAATVTGGDSYCYFLPSRPSKKSNIVDLMLINEGKYPLYDVSIKIDDVETLLGLLKSEMLKGNLPYDSLTQSNVILSQASKIIQVGNIGPNQVVQMPGLEVTNTDKQSYNIYITARNGSIMQTIRFLRVNNEWKMAVKVMGNGKVLNESIDIDFPRNKEGKIDW